jgi:diaminopimelate epimerase
VGVPVLPPLAEGACLPGSTPGVLGAQVQVTAGGHVLVLTPVWPGNPHAVAFLDSPVEAFALEALGPLVERDGAFPHRTNFEIANVLARDEMRVRVWERGAGLTLACGTGACAASVAGRLRGLTDEDVTVHLPGGDLRIEWKGPGESVFMTGPATTVFTGLWPE